MAEGVIHRHRYLPRRLLHQLDICGRVSVLALRTEIQTADFALRRDQGNHTVRLDIVGFENMPQHRKALLDDGPPRGVERSSRFERHATRTFREWYRRHGAFGDFAIGFQDMEAECAVLRVEKREADKVECNYGTKTAIKVRKQR